MSGVRLLGGVVGGRIAAPPSKSYTHRALVAGFLTGRPYHVHHPNPGEDARATLSGLEALGAELEFRRNGWTLCARRGTDAPRPRSGARVDCRSSGTTLRFLTAVAAARTGETSFRGSRELARRPLTGLLDALRAGGARVHGPPKDRALPFSILGRIRPGAYELPGDVSSQYLSAMLFALPGLAAPSTIRVRGRQVSRPYVDATIAVLHAHGVDVRRTALGIEVPAPQRFVGRQFFVPGDVSSAAYLWSAAALTGGRVRVTGIDPRWPQADVAILDLLGSMGARIHRARRAITVEGPVRRRFEADLTAAPDLAPLAAVLAASVPGATSVLRGGPQLLHKESDRREGSEALARAFGAGVRSEPGRIEVTGGRRPRAVRLDGLTDHRLVMAAAVGAASLAAPSLLSDAGAVDKSYPGFWADLAQLGVGVERRT